jgi:hypothetical protein
MTNDGWLSETGSRGAVSRSIAVDLGLIVFSGRGKAERQEEASIEEVARARWLGWRSSCGNLNATAWDRRLSINTAMKA